MRKSKRLATNRSSLRIEAASSWASLKARRAAAARLVAYRDLYDALERELVGDDLLP
ncbi:MAG TPA: hypothetical protein PK095_04940 [Myxococcota bacterium]|nr:hypothetical protein [Myxococcota bacterium]